MPSALYSLPVTTNPAPKINWLISAVFVAGTLGLLVNAAVFEPQRCTTAESLNYDNKTMNECASLLSTFACSRLDGSGSDFFDSSNCGSRICTSVTALESVTIPADQCTVSSFEGSFNCHTSDYTPGGTGYKSLSGCFENDLLNSTCTGSATITRNTCTEYAECQGFYYSTISICPSRFESLGAASGYISASFGVCATLYVLLAKLSKRLSEDASILRTLAKAAEKPPTEMEGDLEQNQVQVKEATKT